MVSKNITPKRGKSRFSLEKLLSHSSEKLRRGTPESFRKLLVAKIFMDGKGVGEEEEGGSNTIFS